MSTATQNYEALYESEKLACDAYGISKEEFIHAMKWRDGLEEIDAPIEST